MGMGSGAGPIPLDLLQLTCSARTAMCPAPPFGDSTAKCRLTAGGCGGEALNSLRVAATHVAIH